MDGSQKNCGLKNDAFSEFVVKECPQSNYVKPFSFYFTQNKRERRWDYIKAHDSVVVIIYNTSSDTLVFVRQFRPAVFANLTKAYQSGLVIGPDEELIRASHTIEFCAGILDDEKLSPAEIAVKEVLEETGYCISTNELEYITSYRASVGLNGAKQMLFYCEVTKKHKVSVGGGIPEEEEIEVIEMSPQQAKEMMYNESANKPPALMFALLWFFNNKHGRKQY